MWFWVDPSASKESFISVLLVPQAGLMIVPMRPLPVSSVLEKPAQSVVEVTGVIRMPGLLVLVVMRWKVALDVIVPLLSPTVLQVALIPRSSAVQPLRVNWKLPVVELPES
jgi:hypothetical protein